MDETEEVFDPSQLYLFPSPKKEDKNQDFSEDEISYKIAKSMLLFSGVVKLNRDSMSRIVICMAYIIDQFGDENIPNIDGKIAYMIINKMLPQMDLVSNPKCRNIFTSVISKRSEKIKSLYRCMDGKVYFPKQINAESYLDHGKNIILASRYVDEEIYKLQEDNQDKLINDLLDIDLISYVPHTGRNASKVCNRMRNLKDNHLELWLITLQDEYESWMNNFYSLSLKYNVSNDVLNRCFMEYSEGMSYFDLKEKIKSMGSKFVYFENIDIETVKIFLSLDLSNIELQDERTLRNLFLSKIKNRESYLTHIRSINDKNLSMLEFNCKSLYGSCEVMNTESIISTIPINEYLPRDIYRFVNNRKKIEQYTASDVSYMVGKGINLLTQETISNDVMRDMEKFLSNFNKKDTNDSDAYVKMCKHMDSKIDHICMHRMTYIEKKLSDIKTAKKQFYKLSKLFIVGKSDHEMCFDDFIVNKRNIEEDDKLWKRIDKSLANNISFFPIFY